MKRWSLNCRINRIQNYPLAAVEDQSLRRNKMLSGNQIPANLWSDFCGPTVFSINQVPLCTSNITASISMIAGKLPRHLPHAFSPPSPPTSPPIYSLPLANIPNSFMHQIQYREHSVGSHRHQTNLPTWFRLYSPALTYFDKIDRAHFGRPVY